MPKAILAFTSRCEKCEGYAFLTRSLPDAFKRDGSEIWTFECVDCGHAMQRPAQQPMSYRGRRA